MAKTEQEKFLEISDDVKAKFDQINQKVHQHIEFNFILVNCPKQKVAVKLQKCNDLWKYVSGADFVVLINEDIFELLDEQSQEILILQELDRIHFDFEKGKVKMSKPDLVTFSGIISKYGIDQVARANRLDDLAQKQLSDQDVEFITA